MHQPIELAAKDVRHLLPRLHQQVGPLIIKASEVDEMLHRFDRALVSTSAGIENTGCKSCVGWMSLSTSTFLAGPV